jgi:hypothetical protein
VRVDWVVPCRYAETPGDGTATILGGGTDTFWVAELPAEIAIFLAMRVAGTEDEWRDETHSLSIKLVRPDLAEEVTLSGDLRIEQFSPLKQPGWEAGMLIPALQRWIAREYGLYTLEVFIDDRRQKSVPISIRDAADLRREASGGVP